MMPKRDQMVVVNRIHGGFGISKAAVLWIRENGGCEHKETLAGELYDDGSGPAGHFGSFSGHDGARDCPMLVLVVQTLKAKANGKMGSLEVVQVPAGVKWTIEEYDGLEWVAEEHRTW